MVPPWETFVQAQQHYIDERRPLAKKNVDDEEPDDQSPPQKRKKMAQLKVSFVGFKNWIIIFIINNEKKETDKHKYKTNQSFVEFARDRAETVFFELWRGKPRLKPQKFVL